MKPQLHQFSLTRTTSFLSDDTVISDVCERFDEVGAFGGDMIRFRPGGSFVERADSTVGLFVTFGNANDDAGQGRAVATRWLFRHLSSEDVG